MYGLIDWLREEFDENEKNKKLTKEIEKIQRQNRLENSLDAIEEEYFETGADALRKRSNEIYEYEIGTVDEYEDACRELGRNIVSEIRQDWESVEKEISEREKSKQSREEEEIDVKTGK